MTLAAAVDHVRTLADSPAPLTTGHSTDQQVRTALKLVVDVCEQTILDRMERDEALLAAATSTNCSPAPPTSSPPYPARWSPTATGTPTCCSVTSAPRWK